MWVQGMQADVLGWPSPWQRGRSSRGRTVLLLAAELAVHSPSWSKWVSVPWGPGMEHTRRALRNVLQRLMRLRFPPTSFCRAPRAGLSPASPSLPHRHALLGPHSGTPPTLSPLLCGRGVVTPSCPPLGPEKVKAHLVGHPVTACWPLVTDLADPGHPGMDVPPLPLPSFHGRLTEKDVDLVIVRVVGIGDGIGTDERGLCRGKEQHDMALCPVVLPLEALGSRVRC